MERKNILKCALVLRCRCAIWFVTQTKEHAVTEFKNALLWGVIRTEGSCNKLCNERIITCTVHCYWSVYIKDKTQRQQAARKKRDEKLLQTCWSENFKAMRQVKGFIKMYLEKHAVLGCVLD
jgi:hypothetical protein